MMVKLDTRRVLINTASNQLYYKSCSSIILTVLHIPSLAVDITVYTTNMQSSQYLYIDQCHGMGMKYHTIFFSLKVILFIHHVTVNVLVITLYTKYLSQLELTAELLITLSPKITQ